MSILNKNNNNINNSNELDYLNIKSSSCITQVISSNQIIREFVSNQTNIAKHIHVGNIMEELDSLSELLQISYAGSIGFKTNIFVGRILFDYQKMVHSSVQTMDSFVRASISSVNFHKMALVFAEKGSINTSLKYISNIGGIAEKMKVKALEMSEKSVELNKKAQEAFVQATTDQHLSIEEKKKLTDSTKQLSATIAGLQVTPRKIEKVLMEYQQEMDKIFVLNMASCFTKASTSVSTFGKFLSLVSLITEQNSKIDEAIAKIISQLEEMKSCLEKEQNELQGLKDKENKDEKETERMDFLESKLNVDKAKILENEKELEEMKHHSKFAHDKEMQYIILKEQYNAKNIEVKSTLAKKQQEILHLTTSKKDLKASLACLELVVGILGKIGTIFLHLSEFWKNIESQSQNQIQDVEIATIMASDENGLHLFINKIKEASIDWFCFANLNNQALVRVQATELQIDKVMSNLPKKANGKQLIQDFVDKQSPPQPPPPTTTTAFLTMSPTSLGSETQPPQ
ncbi:hypothetical protein DFA_09867 [Cavenderia fasciculata]|uniref:Uncharacterized protein n=1 Tax=Cavenderia fasciculata TaxID=261658 RepID=F4QAY5_CACFS|nr:uncharacterized protein DFA_09867 [Cavenderia fasciculata]EGG15044.1 hypothetical protein DFA_09867 [Cavenderia fasciculata]|eukprot:XP_004351764.1 hypothetical protein DFA_09867 [Cavenderia fasciculata]